MQTNAISAVPGICLLSVNQYEQMNVYAPALLGGRSNLQINLEINMSLVIGSLVTLLENGFHWHIIFAGGHTRKPPAKIYQGVGGHGPPAKTDFR